MLEPRVPYLPACVERRFSEGYPWWGGHSNVPRLRHTAVSDGVGAPRQQGSGPSLCPAPMLPADDGSATSSPGPGRKVITHKFVSSPGLKRRYERACGDLGDAALVCKVDYRLRKARGLKECKLPVNNMCQPCEHSAKRSDALRREGLLRYPYNGAPC